MKDLELAKELVSRLNLMINNPEAREFVQRLIETRIDGAAVVQHPTIQVDGLTNEVGFLGLLNGLVGVKSDQWGYIAIEFDTQSCNLVRFVVDDGEQNRAIRV